MGAGPELILHQPSLERSRGNALRELERPRHLPVVAGVKVPGARAVLVKGPGSGFREIWAQILALLSCYLCSLEQVTYPSVLQFPVCKMGDWCLHMGL